jgi:hypothetical protein
MWRVLCYHNFMSLDCPFCSPVHEKTLTRLTQSHPEYYISVVTYDGTKNWYLCSECKGVFCLDKMRGIWQLSPQTYTDFVQKKLIKDMLED